MQHLSEPSVHGRVSANRFFTKDTRQKPHAFRWWEPECDPDVEADAAAGCTGDEPVLENLWEQPPAPLEPFAFRLHADGSLEFKGHLDAAGGAVSNTVAVTLPGFNPGEVDFRPPNDQYFFTVITEDSGTTFTVALVFIEAASGEVTITWPAVT